jgi:6-phosphofructokinase 1
MRIPPDGGVHVMFLCPTLRFLSAGVNTLALICFSFALMVYFLTEKTRFYSRIGEETMRKIGVLTSGGDSPGMNAAVMSVARSAACLGIELIGIKRGFNGLLGKHASVTDDMIEMPLDMILDIADMPGTYLRTARCREFMHPLYQQAAAYILRERNIEGLVVIGGDGSFNGALRLCELGIPCVCIPGTIDNDLPYTEITLGYDSAVNVCVNAIRAIRATSRSHDRAHVVEVMGRNCGDIALSSAVSTGSEILLVPELPWSVNGVAARLQELINRGNTRVTIVAAEGCFKSSMRPFNVERFLRSRQDEKADENRGTKMTAQLLAHILRIMVPESDIRSTVIGYTQRGEAPSARDSIFAFEAGHLATELLSHGVSGRVIGRKKGHVFDMDINQALKAGRRFNKRLYALVNQLL